MADACVLSREILDREAVIIVIVLAEVSLIRLLADTTDIYLHSERRSPVAKINPINFGTSNEESSIHIPTRRISKQTNKQATMVPVVIFFFVFTAVAALPVSYVGHVCLKIWWNGCIPIIGT